MSEGDDDSAGEFEAEQRIAAVDPEIRAHFGNLAERARSFSASFETGHLADELQRCDEAFRLWLAGSRGGEEKQAVIEVVGGYLGQRMVDDCGMRWVVVEDEIGTDYAVHHEATGLLAFPFASVVKRLEDGEHGFVHGIYHVVRRDIEGGR